MQVQWIGNDQMDLYFGHANRFNITLKLLFELLESIGVFQFFGEIDLQ